MARTPLRPPPPMPSPGWPVFPLGGDGPADLRDRTAFSFRAKLDRQGTFEVIGGPRMQDVANETQTAADFATTLASLKPAARRRGGRHSHLGRTRQAAQWLDETAHPSLPTARAGGETKEVQKLIKEPTDLRFAVEEALAVLPQVAPL